MDSVTLFTTNATLIYFGEQKPELEDQAKKLYRMAKNAVVEWVRLELLDACRTPGVYDQRALLCLPACENTIEVSVDTNPFFDSSDNNLFLPPQPPRAFCGSPYSGEDYITPLGRMPYALYKKIMTEETPVSRLFEFLSSEYKKLTDKTKMAVPSKERMEELSARDVLFLYRYGGIIQVFEAMRGLSVA